MPCVVVRRLLAVWLLGGRGRGVLAARGIAVVAVPRGGGLIGLVAGDGDLLSRVDEVGVGDGGQAVRLRCAPAGLEQSGPLVAVAEFFLRDLRQVVARVDGDDVRAVLGGSGRAVARLRADASRRGGGVGHLQSPAGLQEAVRAEDLTVGHGAALVQAGDLPPPLAVAQLLLGDAPQALRGTRLADRVRRARRRGACRG
ncbi:hypothetical protein [Streptomyces sp. NPDC000618]|uniref:hypothetical protein n=1 Tax=Streptomyces sp. NPDC000618 TaxID=3154265 RepID=UPI003322A2E9